MKGVCGCGRRSPPILVAVRVNPAKKIHIKFVKLCMITQHKLTAILLENNAQKSLISLLAMSVRTTSAPQTSDRAMQPQTKPPSPRVSKKRTLKVVFSLQLFCLFAAPPGSPPQPKSCAARLCGGHNRWSRTSKGIPSSLWVHQTRTKPPHVDPLPPIHGLPRPRSDPRDVDDVSMGRADRGSSIAPTGLWCPGGSSPTARSASTASPEPLPPR